MEENILKILICGGAGYIGSHIVRRLRLKGYYVVVLDNFLKGHRSAIKDIPIIEGDILDTNILEKVFSENDIIAVMHFAAFSLVGESAIKPSIYYRNNVVGTLNLLEAMHKFNVNHFIFSSTAAVYGEPVEVPINEEHSTKPTNPYGATKVAVEELLKWFDKAYRMKYISLRYFNAAGADPQGDIGEDHQPESHLIPLVLKTALNQLQLPEIKIFGTDYPTSDGTCIRDYIHVNDLADAHILALERLLNGGESAIYNLGNSNGFSVKEVIQVAEEVVGQPIKAVHAERRVGDPAILVASSEKIKKELGWQPQLNDLKKIIETAWNWHLSHPNGFSK